MKRLYLFGMALITSSVFANPAIVNHSNQPTSLSPDQKAQIENVVHDYLIQNPQVLLEASQALHEEQISDMQKNSQKSIAEHADDLFHDPISPVSGNPKGSVTLVEFSDYQCGHCKEMEPIILSLQKANPNLMIIYKELPIFGANSELAAKMALAAKKQGKFEVIHRALMENSGQLSEDTIMQIAKNAGLNLDKLKADMQNKDYFFELKNNYVLAKQLGIGGTPTFIIASHINNPQNIRSYFVPGAVSQQMLQKVIDSMKSQ